METKDLSVIIVNFNTKALLKDCLNSLIENTRGITYEIIIVDNASSDGSIEMLKNNFPHVKLIANKENLGFAPANNQAAETAKGRFILLLNSDTILKEGDIRDMFKLFEEDKNLGAAGAKVLNEDGSPQASCYRFPNLFAEYLNYTFLRIIFIPNYIYSHNRYLKGSFNKIKKVDCLTGCFLLTKKEIIEKTGLFDGEYFMYYEDFDFCYKLRKNNLKCLYYPYFKIIHYGGRSQKNSFAFEIWLYVLSMRHYFKKNKGTVQTFMLLTSIYISWFVFYAAFSFISIFFNSSRINKKKKLFKQLLLKAAGGFKV